MKKKIKNKSNNWKTASIILGIICLTLIIINGIASSNEVDFGAFKISKENINNFAKVMLDNNKTEIRICSLETNECVMFHR